ncbi:MAG TPA: MBL fold metallo-hydrolase [Candidatus Nanopelagicales bacterium]
MQLTMLGVRGSTPAPGAAYVRYGGHTSAIAVTADGDQSPSLVLDAGTGLRNLSALLQGEPYRGSILLSHLHWDHCQGLPFFVAGDREDAKVDLYVPLQDDMSARDLLARLMSPPVFPISPEGLRGDWSFRGVSVGKTQIGRFAVRATQVTHKGGCTLGYRIDDGSSSVAYLPDHSPTQGITADTLDLMSGVDVLVHDAQFLEAERPMADDYGHCTVEDAIKLAVGAGASTLVLFHHGPARTDDALDEMIAEAQSPVPLVMAVEGTTLNITRAGVVSDRPIGKGAR